MLFFFFRCWKCLSHSNPCFQGDDELARGMPISPYMDRDQQHVAQLQESFINHLVAPLYNSYANAGLIPGEWFETEDSSSDMESDVEESNEEARNPDGERRKPNKSRHRKRRKITSELTANIENNYKMWVEVIKQEEREKRKANKAEAAESADKDSDGESDEELVMVEKSLKNEVIEEEDNGSETGFSTTDSRKETDV